MKILFLYQNTKFQKEISYITNLFFSIFDIKLKFLSYNEYKNSPDLKCSLIISYGKNKPNCVNTKKHIHIYESSFFGENYLKKESLPRLPLKRYNNLPIIYQGENEIENHIKKSDNLIETDIDIIASSFFMVTRYEETMLKDRDEYSRFPYKSSLAFKENFLDRPIVNEYIELLWKWINNFNLGFKKQNLWGNKDFAVCLTHDIDEIKKYRRPPIFTVIRNLKKKDVKKVKNIIWSYLKTKLGLENDPYLKTFDYIIELEKKYGFTSSFYFMTNDKRYSLKDNDLKEIIIKLKKTNSEIGIHPGFNSYNKYNIIRKEKEKLEKMLEKEVLGGRQHYLKFNIPKSYRNWKSAGLKYDSSLGFSNHEGFRCGICHPFKPFDILKNKVIDLWEFPLILMDGTLVARNLSFSEKEKILKSLLEKVKKYNGVFVFLWHNGYMTEVFTLKEKKLFEDFYKLISKKTCLVASVKDLLSLDLYKKSDNK